MTPSGPPQVVREKVSRLTGSRVSVALVCDRDFAPEEISRLRLIETTEEPRPTNFEIEGRVVRYECEASDEPKWRLALEIFLVKMARAAPKSSPRPSTGIRDRSGLRKLHLG